MRRLRSRLQELAATHIPFETKLTLDLPVFNHTYKIDVTYPPLNEDSHGICFKYDRLKREVHTVLTFLDESKRQGFSAYTFLKAAAKELGAKTITADAIINDKLVRVLTRRYGFTNTGLDSAGDPILKLYL